MQKNNLTGLKRRTAITAIPLAIAGVVAVAKGNVGTIPFPANTRGVLDERSLDYAIELMTEASTSGLGCSFVALAHHVATLAAAGDCERIRTIAETLTNYLYLEHNQYSETKERWISEELEDFKDVVAMDDEDSTDKQIEAASNNFQARCKRRGGLC